MATMAETVLPPSPRHTNRVPLDLPRLLMRRAAAVALAVLLLALVLGLARVGHDIDDEVDAAVSLGQLMAGLGSLAQADDAAALDALRRQSDAHPPRHLVLSVQDSAGRMLLAPPDLPPVAMPLNGLLALHRNLLSAPDLRHASWDLTRPGGARWTITLAASHESERREAIANLVGTLSLLLACIAGLLAAMRWNLRRALAPLDRLLAAIAGIEGHATQAVQALPTMPVRELEAVAGALRHLGAALDLAEARRRLLSQQLLTLQEDERVRLAGELHDEFGQRLTALRVDAAWLARRLVGQAEPAQVVAGMAGQCQQIQHDIRSLLTRLQPFGPGGGDAGGVQSLARLTALLQALVAAWSPAVDGDGPACRLDLLAVDGDGAGAAQAWPGPQQADALLLPQGLALTLYRISQEALTNVARHARAQQAVLCLVCRGTLQPGAALQIDWSVSDDGVGLPPAGTDPDAATGAAGLRGNGLSGLRERVWARGGELHCASGTGGRGLVLSARFSADWALPMAPMASMACRPMGAP
jgi:two-component system sensor histidine kinase UhpB